jgi:hypothetical protein
MDEPGVEEVREAGLASALVGGCLTLTAAVGLVFNILVATAGSRVMSRSDARLHGISTAVTLVCVAWAVATGLRLGLRGRGGLAVAGRTLGVLAALLWVLFAIGQAFVLAPLW